MTKIGLILFEKKGHKALAMYPDDVDFYATHPDMSTDMSVLFSPQHSSTVVRYGPEFEWLVELLEGKVGEDGLDILILPPRKNCDVALSLLHHAGLIGRDTVIHKGNKLL